MWQDDEPIEKWHRRIQAGDISALAELFDHFRPRLERLLKLRMNRRLSGRVDPADILQDAYLDASRQVENLRQMPAKNTYLWLRGLALQRMLKTFRQHLGTQRRDAQREMQLPDQSSADLANFLALSQSTPSRVVQAREIAGQIESALQRLKQEDREVVLLRHVEGLTNGQVAQLLNISDSAATMRYGRALVRLKEQLSFILSEGGPHS